MILCIVIGMTVSSVSAFDIGQISTSYFDAERNRNIGVNVFYPADAGGSSVPVADGVFPVVVFGHGFLLGTGNYDFVRNSLVPQGYIVALPTTESGFSPNHLTFGLDLAFLSDYFQEMASDPDSMFFERIAPESVIMGHSMGGGASFLAIEFSDSVVAIANFAAAETSPSAIAAAGNIAIPALLFAGTEDCVTPPQNHQIPMYNALASDCKTYISINGASHCQFAQNAFICTLGETGCSADISLMEQETITMQYLSLWLDVMLKGNESSWTAFQNLLNSGVADETITYQQQCDAPDPYYEVRLLSSHPDGNVILSGQGIYLEGQTVEINAHSDTLIFVEWTGASEDLALLDFPYSQTASFIMPPNDVQFTAIFTDPANEKIPALISIENPLFEGIWKWSYNSIDTMMKGPLSINSRQLWTWNNIISDITARKMIAADLSNDGTPELVMLIPDNGLWVYNFHSGMFTVVANECSDFTIARTSRNGQQQIIFSNDDGTYIWDYLNNLDSLIINVPAEIIISTDLYRDGIDELIVGFRGINRLFSYSFAENSFSTIALVNPSSMTSGDITGDGYDELICSFEGFGIYLFRHMSGIDEAPKSFSGKFQFDPFSDVPSNDEWFSFTKGLHIQRLTYADLMPGHSMITGNIAFGNSSELIVSIEGRTYYYSYGIGWSTLIFAPMKTIIAGKFTGNHKDDLITCESNGGSIYLRESGSGHWYLLANGGDSNAMTPYRSVF